MLRLLTALFLLLFGGLKPLTAQVVEQVPFAHRGIGLNTAAPLKQGTLNYYNYYLLYNELEYAITNRVAISAGSVLLPGLTEEDIPISLRFRYAVQLNERLSWAFGYQSLQFYSRFSGETNIYGSSLLSSTITYHSPRFVGSLTGGTGRRIDWYDEPVERAMIVSLYAIYLPFRNKRFGVMADLNYGPGYARERIPLTRYEAFGVYLSGRSRVGFQVFAIVAHEDSRGAYLVPGASMRLMIRKPRRVD